MTNARGGRRPSIVALASTGILALALHASSVLAPRVASAEPVTPGEVLVVTGPSESEAGGLLRVDRHAGTRTLVSDFADPR